MAGLIGFVLSAVVSILDPIAMTGYVLAGALIRPYWAAIGTAVGYRFIVQLVFVPGSAPSSTFLAALIGAVIATSVTYLITRAVRRSRTAPK